MANMHETFLQVFDDASTILEVADVVVSVGVGGWTGQCAVTLCH